MVREPVTRINKRTGLEEPVKRINPRTGQEYDIKTPREILPAPTKEYTSAAGAEIDLTTGRIQSLADEAAAANPNWTASVNDFEKKFTERAIRSGYAVGAGEELQRAVNSGWELAKRDIDKIMRQSNGKLDMPALVRIKQQAGQQADELLAQRRSMAEGSGGKTPNPSLQEVMFRDVWSTADDLIKQAAEAERAMLPAGQVGPAQRIAESYPRLDNLIAVRNEMNYVNTMPRQGWTGALQQQAARSGIPSGVTIERAGRGISATPTAPFRPTDGSVLPARPA